MTKTGISDRSENKHRVKFEGFDFLRAIFSVVIVALHTALYDLVEVGNIDTLKNLLYANVSYLAVPVFLQISLFLFYLKSGNDGIQYFVKKRFPKLIQLYLFWVTSKVIFNILFKGEKVTEFENLSFKGIIEFVASGGYSPFYFFFSLIFLCAFAAILVSLFGKIKNPKTKAAVNYLLLSFTCALVFYFSVLGLANNNASDNHETLFDIVTNIAKWNYNPLDFLPYIFTAAIAAQEFNEGKLERLSPLIKLKLYILFVLFLAFSSYQWSIAKTLDNMLQYSRVSLVLGSWLLLYLALLLPRKAPKIIQYLSKYSLGIYVFHVFFRDIILLVSANFPNFLSFPFWRLDVLFRFLIVLTSSIVMTVIFRRIKGLKEFV